eukprot:3035290-Rhodomonas_salina.3
MSTEQYHLAEGNVRPLLLDPPGVDYARHVVDGDAGLRHVRAEHHLAHSTRGVHEDLALVVGGEAAVQGQDPVGVQGKPAGAWGGARALGEQIQRFFAVLDLARAGQKDLMMMTTTTSVCDT